MVNIKISVIVPIYGIPEKIFRFCVDSIINQSLKDIEIILVDDGNKKNNLPIICDEYASNDNRVITIHQNNSGVSSARNHGIRVAKAPYVVFVDADDWLDYNALECGLQAMELNSVDIVLWDYNVVSEDSYYISETDVSKQVLYKTSKEIEYLQRSMAGGTVGAPTGLKGGPVCKVYIRDIIINNDVFFDETLPRSQDNEFNFRYFEYVNTALYIPHALYYYRLFNDSATHKFNSNAIEIMTRFLFVLKNDLLNLSKEQVFFNDYYYIARNKYADICRIYFCHPDNPTSRCEIVKEMKELYLNETFREVFEMDTTHKELKIMKLVVPLLRRKRFATVYFLFKIRHFIKSPKL